MLERYRSADVIWLANLRFPDDVVASVNDLLEQRCALDKDAVVATLRECPSWQSPRLIEAWTQQVPMSWNPSGWPVFFYHLRAKWPR